jgi:Dynamin family
MQRSVEQLIEIVDRYDLHVNVDLLHALENLRKRTATHRLTLAVFGDSRESKSSLLRVLLGITLEETSIPPSTAACTYLAYGLQGDCAVTLADNMTAWLPLDQLAGFVSEKAPASNLKKVLVRIPNAALENGLVVIDTPDLTDDPEPLLSLTAAAIAEADACVFVVKAGDELKEPAIAFLRRMQSRPEKFFFVLESGASARGMESAGGIEKEKSLSLLRHSLQQRCGLAKPRVALLSSASPEGSDSSLRGEGSAACQAMLLGFARLSWQSLTAHEVARLAGEVLTQADSALTLRETTPLERMKLRRVLKTLDGISRESAEVALTSDAAMRTLVEPAGETAADESEPPLVSAPAVAEPAAPIAPPEAIAPAPDAVAPDVRQSHVQESSLPSDSQNGFSSSAPEAHPVYGGQFWESAANAPKIMQTTGTMETMGRMQATPSFTGESLAAWVVLPSSTPISAQLPPAAAPLPATPRRAVPRIFDPEPEEPEPEQDPDSEPSESAAGNAGEPAMPPFEWRSNRDERPFTRDEWRSNLNERPSERNERPSDHNEWRSNLNERPFDRNERPSTSNEWRSNPNERPSSGNQWRGRDAVADYAYDDDELTRGDGIGPLWKVAGFAALLVAALVIAWAAVIVVRPDSARPEHVRANLAQLLAWRPVAWRPAAAPVQPGASSPATPVPPPASGGAASSEGASTPPPATPPAEEATPSVPSPRVEPKTDSTVSSAENAHSAPVQPLAAGPHSGTANHSRNLPPDAALESALDKWIAASRSGNIQAQASCYAPVVGTYFNSRNVTREQIQRQKERVSVGAAAGVQNFRITTVGISDQGNGQRAVLVQKDWETPAGRGPDFAGTEIEKLVFAQVEGQWKIVDEQEVKLGKTHRARSSRQVAANF